MAEFIRHDFGRELHKWAHTQKNFRNKRMLLNHPLTLLSERLQHLKNIGCVHFFQNLVFILMLHQEDTEESISPLLAHISAQNTGHFSPQYGSIYAQPQW